MTPRGWLIDSELLVLLVVGRTDLSLIAKHKRTRDHYSIEDYQALQTLIGSAPVYLTPNTLTETSNLLRQHREPQRRALTVKLAELISDSTELIVRSSEASNQQDYPNLGLTDAAILTSSIRDDISIITADGDLYRAALKHARAEPINFTHYRFQG